VVAQPIGHGAAVSEPVTATCVGVVAIDLALLWSHA
jgi:hypothetical protein